MTHTPKDLKRFVPILSEALYVLRGSDCFAVSIIESFVVG